MPDLELVTSNDHAWRRCGAHDMVRDPETLVCDGCAADARPACTWCHGTGETNYHSGGLNWPQECRCRRTWPDTYQLDREDYTPQ